VTDLQHSMAATLYVKLKAGIHDLKKNPWFAENSCLKFVPVWRFWAVWVDRSHRKKRVVYDGHKIWFLFRLWFRLVGGYEIMFDIFLDYLEVFFRLFLELLSLWMIYFYWNWSCTLFTSVAIKYHINTQSLESVYLLHKFYFSCYL